MIVMTLAGLLAVGCGTTEPEPLDPKQVYNACINRNLVAAAEAVGAPTDTKPTPEEMATVEAELVKRCGPKP